MLFEYVPNSDVWYSDSACKMKIFFRADAWLKSWKKICNSSMKPSKIGLAYFLENVNSVGWKENWGN